MISAGTSEAAPSGAAVRSSAGTGAGSSGMPAGAGRGSAVAIPLPCLRGAACGHAQASGCHVLHDALSVERGNVVLYHHPPEIEDGDAVRYGEHVVQVVGDHDDPQAVVPETTHE